MAGKRSGKQVRIASIRGQSGRPSRHVGQGSRYTPPKPHPERAAANKLYLVLFAALLGAGVLAIALNFLLVLPGSQSAWYVLLGLALMASSFFAIVRYR